MGMGNAQFFQRYFMCCIMKLFREIIFKLGKLMFLHKNIKLFGHLALLKGGVLVKKNVTVVCLSNMMLL